MRYMVLQFPKKKKRCGITALEIPHCYSGGDYSAYKRIQDQ